jgi:hypothetical protein
MKIEFTTGLRWDIGPVHIRTGVKCLTPPFVIWEDA